jgi:F0F1-type ATP synthase assembly protein I
MSYEIDVELEVPASAAGRDAPWDQLQTFTRLDGPVEIASSADLTIDALRSGAVTLSRMLNRAREGFARHCRSAAAGSAQADVAGEPFLTVWLDAALRAVHDVREKLTRPAQQDPAPIARERLLADEYVSVRLLDMLADAARVSRESTAQAALRDAFEGAAARVSHALRDEMSYRRSRGFPEPDAASPEALERYIARAASLKKHFEEVLFLDRESEQLDERVQLWTRVAGALVAGIVVSLPLQFLLSRRAGDLGLGLIAFALLTGIAYAAREHIKERGRSWLTGKMVRFQSQRVLRCRVPARRLPRRDVLVEAREWCRQTTRSRPDPLHPEAGASLRATQVQYLHRGTVRPQADLWNAGVRRVLHIFRYDLSPLFPRLDDEAKQVPVVDAGGEVAFVAAPRRYHVPILVGLTVDGEHQKDVATLVLDRAGLRRLDRTSDETTATSTEMTRPP